MKEIFALTAFLFKGLLIKKTTIVLSVFSILVLILGISFSETNIAVKHQFARDIMLGAQMLLLHIGAFLYAYELRERDRAGGFVIPLSIIQYRIKYLAAIFLSLLAIMIFNFIVLAILDLLIYTIFFRVFELSFFLQLFYYSLSAIIASSLVIVIAQKVNTINAIFYALAIFIIGSANDELMVYASKFGNEYINMASQVFFYILINFSLFDLTRVVNIPFGEALVLLYFIIVYFVLFALCNFIFQNRPLKIE